MGILVQVSFVYPWLRLTSLWLHVCIEEEAEPAFAHSGQEYEFGEPSRVLSNLKSYIKVSYFWYFHN